MSRSCFLNCLIIICHYKINVKKVWKSVLKKMFLKKFTFDSVAFQKKMNSNSFKLHKKGIYYYYFKKFLIIIYTIRLWKNFKRQVLVSYISFIKIMFFLKTWNVIIWFKKIKSLTAKTFWHKKKRTNYFNKHV